MFTKLRTSIRRAWYAMQMRRKQPNVCCRACGRPIWFSDGQQCPTTGEGHVTSRFDAWRRQ